MKKKHIPIVLLVIGIVLLCSSVILAVIATENKNVIGGADFPTFVFVFFRESKGIYSTIAFCGIVALISPVVVNLRKAKK